MDWGPAVSSSRKSWVSGLGRGGGGGDSYKTVGGGQVPSNRGQRKF